MKKLLNQLNLLANKAGSKSLLDAQARFAQFQNASTLLKANAGYKNIKPYVKAVAYHFDAKLNESKINQADLNFEFENTLGAMQVSIELANRLAAKTTDAEINKLNVQQKQKLQAYLNDQNALKDLVNNSKYRLSLKAIQELNAKTAALLEELGEKNLPSFTPKTKADANIPGLQYNPAKKILFNLVDAINNLCTTISTGGDMQQSLNGFMKIVVGIFANALGSMLKITLGKGSEDKIDSLEKNVVNAFGTYMDNLDNSIADSKSKLGIS